MTLSRRFIYSNSEKWLTSRLFTRTIDKQRYGVILMCIHACVFVDISAALSSSCGEQYQNAYRLREAHLKKPEERAGAACLLQNQSGRFYHHSFKLDKWEWMQSAGLIVCEKGLLLIDRPIKTSLTSGTVRYVVMREMSVFENYLQKSPVRMHLFNNKRDPNPSKCTSNRASQKHHSSQKEKSMRECSAVCWDLRLEI